MQNAGRAGAEEVGSRPIAGQSVPEPAVGQVGAERGAGRAGVNEALFALPFLGAVFACGRRTVTGGIRAAGLSDQFRTCSTAGKKAGSIAAYLLVRCEPDAGAP